MAARSSVPQGQEGRVTNILPLLPPLIPPTHQHNWDFREKQCLQWSLESPTLNTAHLGLAEASFKGQIDRSQCSRTLPQKTKKPPYPQSTDQRKLQISAIGGNRTRLFSPSFLSFLEFLNIFYFSISYFLIL